MDFRFEETQTLFAETVREMLSRECTASELRSMIDEGKGSLPNSGRI